MMRENALTRIGINQLIKLPILILLFIFSTISCSDTSSSNEVGILDDSSGSGSQQLVGEDQSVLQVYSETGDTGMRATYSPMSLMAFSDVEALESVYAELMACVGLSTATPPAILLSNDTSLFYSREDGTDVQGYYNQDTTSVVVYSDDIDPSYGNQYWWTRHGMIEYLIDVHDLSPDSDISPFLRCHFADA